MSKTLEEVLKKNKIKNNSYSFVSIYYTGSIITHVFITKKYILLILQFRGVINYITSLLVYLGLIT